MVNEFGSVGLDGDLIRSCGFCPDDELDCRLVELNNGCLCCTVQDDFLTNSVDEVWVQQNKESLYEKIRKEKHQVKLHVVRKF